MKFLYLYGNNLTGAENPENLHNYRYVREHLLWQYSGIHGEAQFSKVLEFIT
ncbi:hypothetical protein ACS0TY_028422 [Phlomoides rotata]